MTGYRGMSEHLKRQYSGLYGPYVASDYEIGDQVSAGGVRGEIIWSYRKGGTGPVTLVIDDNSGWPVEVEARQVRS